MLSTVGDFLRFARMLRAGGELPSGERLLRQDSVVAMISDQIRPLGLGIEPSGAVGWGFGVDVQRRAVPGEPRRSGSYGWVGGLGTTWLNDPSRGLCAVLFTNQALTSPDPPEVMDRFWRQVDAALG